MSLGLRGTLLQSQLAPGQVIKHGFGNWIFPKDGSDELRIRKFLNYVWVDTLDLNLDLKGQMADKEEFKAMSSAEDIETLSARLRLWQKVLQKEGTWEGLFEDGTSFFFSYFKKNDQVLCLEVLLKSKMIYSASMRGMK